LVTFLGGEQDAGPKMKNTTGWEQKDDFNDGNPLLNGNNTSGFSALPAGICSGEGMDSFIELDAEWWSATDWSASTSPKHWAWSCRLYYDLNSNVSINGNLTKNCGLSVRCVKN
jgi:uncharacterized protein (TIGR02145 family)